MTDVAGPWDGEPEYKAETTPKELSCHEYMANMHNMQIVQYANKYVPYALHVQYTEYTGYIMWVVCK